MLNHPLNSLFLAYSNVRNNAKLVGIVALASFLLGYCAG